jgi:hypothetical protein
LASQTGFLFHKVDSSAYIGHIKGSHDPGDSAANDQNGVFRHSCYKLLLAIP